MIAVIELDLTVLSNLKPFLIVILGAIAGYLLLWPQLSQLLSNLRNDSTTNFKRENAGRSSDTPPPKGFAEHLKIIETTAPNADTTVWWQYAMAELTEAEVAIAEAKLARRPVTAGEAVSVETANSNSKSGK